DQAAGRGAWLPDHRQGRHGPQQLPASYQRRPANLSGGGRWRIAHLPAGGQAAHGATLLSVLTMRTVNKYLPGTAIAPSLIQRAPKVQLAYASRRRSRQKLTLDSGETIALLLNQGSILHHGDVLVADDGGFIVVQAALEPVLYVQADTTLALTRAAYHLGNRHRSEEHTSELQSRENLVCRLLL